MTLISQLESVSKELFNKKDFIRAGQVNLAIDALSEVIDTLKQPSSIEVSDDDIYKILLIGCNMEVGDINKEQGIAQARKVLKMT